MRNFLKTLNELREPEERISAPPSLDWVYMRACAPARMDCASFLWWSFGLPCLYAWDSRKRSGWFQWDQSQWWDSRAVFPQASSVHLEAYTPSHQALGQLNSPGPPPSHLAWQNNVMHGPVSLRAPFSSGAKNSIQVRSGSRQGVGPELYPRTPGRPPSVKPVHKGKSRCAQ